MACDGGYDELLIDAERVMLLAAILVSARLLRRSAADASVSGRWRRLDGLKEGDFIPLGKGRGRSQLGFESEPARIDDGAGSDLNRSQLRFLEGQARLRDGAGSVSSPLR